jgi:hypothetical protein
MESNPKDEKTSGCEHIFTISHITNEWDYTGTHEDRIAYIICQKCGLVKRQKVE